MEEPLSSPEDLESDLISNSDSLLESESEIESSDSEAGDGVESLGPGLAVSSSVTSLSRSPAPGSQYSSSTEPEESLSVASRKRGEVKRRKKRKRVSTDSSRSNADTKTVLIEDALKLSDKDKLSQLAVSEGGLICDEVIHLTEIELNTQILQFSSKVTGKSLAEIITDQPFRNT